MKTFTLLVLSCVYTFLSAQDTISKFSVGPYISATLAGRFLTIEDYLGEVAAYDFDGERSNPGCSFGLLTGYAVHQKITLLTAFSLTNNGYLKQKTEATHTPSPIMGTATHKKRMYKYYY